MRAGNCKVNIRVNSYDHYKCHPQQDLQTIELPNCLFWPKIWSSDYRTEINSVCHFLSEANYRLIWLTFTDILTPCLIPMIFLVPPTSPCKIKFHVHSFPSDQKIHFVSVLVSQEMSLEIRSFTTLTSKHLLPVFSRTT